MDALVMNLQPQMTADVTGQAARPIARTDGAENKGIFVRMLQQAAGADGGGQEASLQTGETAPASVLLPVNVLAAFAAEQSGAEELVALIDQLLAALKADGNLVDQLLEDPQFAEWLAEAMALLFAPARTDSAETALSGETAAEWENGLIQTLLMRLAGRLASDEPDATAEAMAEKLNHVITALAGKFPTLSSAAGETVLKATAPVTEPESTLIQTEQQVRQAQQQSTAKTEQRDETLQPMIRILESTAGSEDTANQRLLDRLAHMNPAVAIRAVGAAEGTVGSESAATVAKPSETTVQTAMVTPAEETPTATFAVANPMPDKAADALARQPVTQTTVVNARHFAEEMAEFVVKHFTVTRTGLVSEAKITLVPEHLGQLDVKITVQNGAVTALFSAENATAKNMLELQLPVLRAALEQQGLQVDRLVVSQQQAGGPANGHFQDDRGRHAGNQERRQSGSREAAIEAESFDYLLDLDESYGREALLGYGSTFHATA